MAMGSARYRLRLELCPCFKVQKTGLAGASHGMEFVDLLFAMGVVSDAPFRHLALAKGLV